MWTLEQLEPEIDDIRARVLQHRRGLKEYFVARDEEIDLAILCAVAQEPLLLVGPPGTAKSDLVVKLTESLGLGQGDYFEYMLTKFTEPSEILGPIDIQVLKEGRYLRRTRGMLPDCRVAFLDEIFKSNSAILNTLLTILNERKFYQDGQPTPVRLIMLFAATNDIPDQTELEAMADRFILKIETKPVKDRHFSELIDAGVMNEAYRASGQKPWTRGAASLDDFLKLKRFMDLSFGMPRASQVVTASCGSRAPCSPSSVASSAPSRPRTRSSSATASSSSSIKVIRTQAFLNHGGPVQHADLGLLAYVGQPPRRARRGLRKVKALGLSSG
jgi:MoxR-like ATPase